MRAESAARGALLTLLCKVYIVKGLELAPLRHSQPWKVSPQTRAEKEKNARRGGCGGVAQLPKHHQTNPAFLTGGFVVVAATPKP